MLKYIKVVHMNALRAPQIRRSFVVVVEKHIHIALHKKYEKLPIARLNFFLKLVDTFGIGITLQVEGSVDRSPRTHRRVNFFINCNSLYSRITTQAQYASKILCYSMYFSYWSQTMLEFFNFFVLLFFLQQCAPRILYIVCLRIKVQ